MEHNGKIYVIATRTIKRSDDILGRYGWTYWAGRSIPLELRSEAATFYWDEIISDTKKDYTALYQLGMEIAESISKVQEYTDIFRTGLSSVRQNSIGLSATLLIYLVKRTILKRE